MRRLKKKITLILFLSIFSSVLAILIGFQLSYETRVIETRHCSRSVPYKYPKALQPYYIMTLEEIPLLKYGPFGSYPDWRGIILSHGPCDPAAPYWLSNCNLDTDLSQFVLVSSEKNQLPNLSLPSGFKPASQLRPRGSKEPHIRAFYGLRLTGWESYFIYNGYGWRVSKPETEVYWLIGYQEATAEEALCEEQ